MIYLGSFSKTLAPGFRVGWIVGPPQMTAKFELAKQAADICSRRARSARGPPAIARGLLATQGERAAAHYQHKRTVMGRRARRSLQRRAPLGRRRGAASSCGRPCPAGLDADRLLTRAIRGTVNYVFGSAFFVDGSGADTLRLCFSQATDEQIVEGVRRLARAIRAEMDAYGAGAASAAGRCRRDQRAERDLVAERVGQRNRRRLQSALQASEIRLRA